MSIAKECWMGGEFMGVVKLTSYLCRGGGDYQRGVIGLPGPDGCVLVAGWCVGQVGVIVGLV